MDQAKIDQMVIDYQDDRMSLARTCRRANVSPAKGKSVLVAAGIPIRSKIEGKKLVDRQNYEGRW